MRRAPSLVLALFLAACSSTPASEFAGSVSVGAGGRAEGRLLVAAGSSAELELVRVGPGSGEYEVVSSDGKTLAKGSIDRARVSLGGTTASSVTITLRAGPAPIAVGYSVEGGTGLELNWDLSKAYAPVR